LAAHKTSGNKAVNLVKSVPNPPQITAARQRELRLQFWNAVIKTANVTMVFGVPTVVTFSVL
jgi:hypothetical protein